jgi:hypothetical protein
MKHLFLLSTIAVFLFTGCKKDSGSGNVTLKYEIESSSAFTPVILNGVQLIPPLTVTYINETGQQQREEINSTSSSWSKTIQLTNTQRPIAILFYVSASTLNSQGTGVVRIYANGSLVASQNATIMGGLTGTGLFSGNLVHNLF